MSDDLPPIEAPILFLAGEFGQEPRWYPGFCWQSSLPGQMMKFYVYPWHFGFPAYYPPFGAPPYLGEWRLITDVKVLEYINSRMRDGSQAKEE